MPEVVIFADVIKNVTIVIVIIKTIIKYSKKVKIQSTSIFLDITKFADFRWQNASWLLQSRDLHIFWIFLRYVITAPSFIIVEYVWQILGRGGGPFWLTHPNPWAAPKKPFLNRVKCEKMLTSIATTWHC